RLQAISAKPIALTRQCCLHSVVIHPPESRNPLTVGLAWWVKNMHLEPTIGPCIKVSDAAKNTRPLRIAVIGSDPAGSYASNALAKATIPEASRDITCDRVTLDIFG